jgi:hypothetical protein
MKICEHGWWWETKSIMCEELLVLFTYHEKYPCSSTTFALQWSTETLDSRGNQLCQMNGIWADFIAPSINEFSLFWGNRSYSTPNIVPCTKKSCMWIRINWLVFSNRKSLKFTIKSQIAQIHNQIANRSNSQWVRLRSFVFFSERSHFDFIFFQMTWKNNMMGLIH